LDRLFFWTADDLERKLESFKNYYNTARVHQGRSGDTPDEKAGGPAPQVVGLENYRWQSHSGIHGNRRAALAGFSRIAYINGRCRNGFQFRRSA
jgi:hypothetical protein